MGYFVQVSISVVGSVRGSYTIRLFYTRARRVLDVVYLERSCVSCASPFAFFRQALALSRVFSEREARRVFLGCFPRSTKQAYEVWALSGLVTAPPRKGCFFVRPLLLWTGTAPRLQSYGRAVFPQPPSPRDFPAARHPRASGTSRPLEDHSIQRGEALTFLSLSNDVAAGLTRVTFTRARVANCELHKQCRNPTDTRKGEEHGTGLGRLRT